jgi:glycosyltransferase involved in cell wall biosynthesis
MGLSIIIPTRNRGESLKRLFKSFASLEYPDALPVEVLVVDNGSTDRTIEFLAQELEKSNKFRLGILHETRTGKSHSLNCGLSHAQGKILFVLDDDVVVHPQWLAKHLECYQSTSFDALQGRVLPGVDPEGNPADPERLLEYNIPIVSYGDEIQEIRGLTGSNMSFKREVFEKVGLFDVRLGPGASGFSEDTEYSMRMRAAGFTIGYTPFAVVYHELDPRRYGRGYNRLVHYRKGLSRSVYRNESVAFHVLPDLVVNCIRFALYKALGNQEKAYKTEGRILRYWGFFLGRVQRKMGRRPQA